MKPCSRTYATSSRRASRQPSLGRHEARAPRRSRAAPRAGRAAALEPVVVAPLVGRPVDARGRLRRHSRGTRTGLPSGAAVRRRRAPRTCTPGSRPQRRRLRPRSRTSPAARACRRALPAVPVADDRDSRAFGAQTAKRRRPPRRVRRGARRSVRGGPPGQVEVERAPSFTACSWGAARGARPDSANSTDPEGIVPRAAAGGAGLRPAGAVAGQGRAVTVPPRACGGCWRRDRHPVGTVAELVAELVDGLLELEHGQQALDLLLAGREQTRLRCREVAVQELGAASFLPALRRLDPSLDRRGRRSVGEGAQHPGHVAQG